MRKAIKKTLPMQVLLSSDGLQTEVKDNKRPKLKKVSSSITVLAIGCIMGMVGLIFPMIGLSGAAMVSEPFAEAWKAIPSELEDIAIAERTVFYDKTGAPFAELWDENRIELETLDEINSHSKEALINTEDKRFYEHNGFDFLGTLRAAATRHGGGSGITQQLIKNLLFYNLLGKEGSKESATEQTLDRKLQELKLAMEYEKKYTKDEILLKYFNTVSFGSPTVYGIETASRYFFNKPAKDLTLAESTALVGTAQNPVKYNMKNPEAKPFWTKRQKQVLDRMVAEKTITQAEAEKAKNTELVFSIQESSTGNCHSSKYPMYCEYTLEYLSKSPRLGETQEERDTIIARGGLQVTTHLDPVALETAERILKEGYGTTNRIVAPTAIVEPGTGGVLAIAQNRDWGVGEGRTELIAPNIPSGEGSTYKIFTLAAALNEGKTEEDLTFGSECPLQPGPDYDSPPGGFKNSNSCGLQGGVLDYKQATAFSSNTWYITLEMDIGVEAVKEFSRSVGLSAPDYMGPRSLAYTLGVVGNSPINLAAATATFANKGVYCPATPVVKISYSDGSVPAIPDTYNPELDSCRAVMSPHNAGVVLKAMRANVSGEVPGAFGLAGNIAGHDSGGKSGTNQEQNVAWIHITGRYSVFTNTYDMDRPANGVNGVWFRGYSRRWSDNTARQSASDILRELLAGKPNAPLAFDETDTTFDKTPLNESDFFTVPSVAGLPPEQAVSILQSVGIITNVSKEFKPLPAGYSQGVVVQQSIAAGEKLAKGTKKEIILFLGK
jgi:membrane peptidoglycan carboxypeptidase